MIADFFRFWYSTKPFQINIDIKTHLNKKTLWKVTLNLKEKRINFIRRHEIWRVWDVSLPRYPSQRLWVFWWQKVSYSKKTFCNLTRLYFANCARKLFQHEKSTTSTFQLIYVLYLHLSLTHSLTHWPVHNIPDAPTKRYFFSKKNISMKASFLFLSWQQ